MEIFPSVLNHTAFLSRDPALTWVRPVGRGASAGHWLSVRLQRRPWGRLLGAARASCGARAHRPQDRELPWPKVLRQDPKDPLLRAWHPLFLRSERCPHDP